MRIGSGRCHRQCRDAKFGDYRSGVAGTINAKISELIGRRRWVERAEAGFVAKQGRPVMVMQREKDFDGVSSQMTGCRSCAGIRGPGCAYVPPPRARMVGSRRSRRGPGPGEVDRLPIGGKGFAMALEEIRIIMPATSSIFRRDQRSASRAVCRREPIVLLPEPMKPARQITGVRVAHRER